MEVYQLKTRKCPDILELKRQQLYLFPRTFTFLYSRTEKIMYILSLDTEVTRRVPQFPRQFLASDFYRYLRGYRNVKTRNVYMV